MKLELIKYDNANCLEATWKEVITTIQEVEKEIEVDGVLTKKLVQIEVQIEVQAACVAYTDVQIDLLRADALKYGTSLNEYEDLITEVEANIYVLTDEELVLIAVENERQRISAIKSKAGEIITSKYSIIKQLNISNLLDGYSEEDKTKMIVFINSIRAISNKAELKGTALEDIDWGVL